ncbi:MAG: hypothetical protein WAV54_06645 [Acidimicrobiales bacterium]
MEAQATRRDLVLAPGTRSTSAFVALVLLVAAGTLAACSVAAGGTHGGAKPSQGTASTSTSLVGNGKTSEKAPATFGVGLSSATWTESQGSTENFYEGTSRPGRVMQVEILYPTLGVKPPTVMAWAPPAYRYGPYPVIVFAHGFNVDPGTYRALLVSWVEAGYVVVAPFFPDTSLPAVEAQHGVDTELDVFNQPADIAFIVSQVVEAALGSPPPDAAYLVGLVNPGRLILAGQSDGADTIAALLYDHEYAGTLASMGARPTAVVLLSGAEWAREQDVYSAPSGGGPPALVVQSLTDSCNDPADSSQLYNMLTGSKWFLALEDATHLGPYVGDGAAAATVEQVTVGFFDLEVGRGKVAPATLEQEGDQPGVSTISSAVAVPLYPAPAYVAGVCAVPAGT